jgi:hypothetical protein
MVVGDVVNDVGVIGVTLTFQPALGVSIMISVAQNYSNFIQITDGVNTGVLYHGTQGYVDTANVKIMINNTNYLSILSAADSSVYTGIQIQ